MNYSRFQLELLRKAFHRKVVLPFILVSLNQFEYSGYKYDKKNPNNGVLRIIFSLFFRIAKCKEHLQIYLNLHLMNIHYG